MIDYNRNKYESMNHNSCGSAIMGGQYWMSARDNSQVKHTLASGIKSRINKNVRINEMNDCVNARQEIDLQNNNNSNIKMLKRSYPASAQLEKLNLSNANNYHVNPNVDNSKRVKGNMIQEQVKTPGMYFS
jgi:hypothetical protein